MRITWVIDLHHAQMHEVASAEEAVKLLVAEVRRICLPLGPDVASIVLTQMVAPLRHAMLTEGARAVAQNESWHGARGQVLVTLEP